MNRRILRKSIRNNNVRHQEQGLKTRTLKDQKQSQKRGQRQQQQTRRGIKKQREHEDKTTKLTVTRSCGSKQLVTNQRKDTKVTKVAKLTKSAKRKKKLSKRSLAQSGGGHVRKKRQTKRIASLNASAKVHCLYERDIKALHVDITESPLSLSLSSPSSSSSSTSTITSPYRGITRCLRSVPGLRGFGRNWDMGEALTSSSSSLNSLDNEPSKEAERKVTTGRGSRKSMKKGITPKSITKRPRTVPKKPELSLKDFVVKKRMASLNASAMMAASMERKSSSSGGQQHKSHLSSSSDVDKKKLIEVCATPTAKQLAVIVNHQDTDVTITGVYTSRSTGDGSGYCSMQYRISAASETTTLISTPITTATTTLVTNSTGADSTVTEMKNEPDKYVKACKPLDALNSMQIPPPSPILNHSTMFNNQNQTPPIYLPQTATGMLPYHQIVDDTNQRYVADYNPMIRGQFVIAPGQSAFSVPQSSINAGCYQPPPGVPANVGQYVHPNMQPLDTSQPQTLMIATQSEMPLESMGNGQSHNNFQCGGPQSTPPHHPFFPYQIFSYQQSSSPYYQQLMPPTTPVGHHQELMYPSTPQSAINRRYLHPPLAPLGPQQPTMMQTMPHSFYNSNILNHAIMNQGATTSNSVLDPYQPMPLFQPQNQYYPATPSLYGQTDYQTNIQNARNYNFAGQTDYQANIQNARNYNFAGQTDCQTNIQNARNYNFAGQTDYQANIQNARNYNFAGQTDCQTNIQNARNYNFAGQTDYQTNIQNARNYNFAEPMPTNTNYQGYPCQLQTFPKNVHTRPLSGNSSSNGSNKVHLPPVALALPLEPTNVGNPPSPARGSAGMPPAGATTYQTNLSPLLISKLSPSSFHSTSSTVTTAASMLPMCHELQKSNSSFLSEKLTPFTNFCTSPLRESPIIKQEVHSPFEKEKEPQDLTWHPPITTSTITSTTSICHTTRPTITEVTNTEKYQEKQEIEPVNSNNNITIDNDDDEDEDDSSGSNYQKLLICAKKVQNSPKPLNKSSYKNLIKKTSIYTDSPKTLTIVSVPDKKRKLITDNSDKQPSKLKKIKVSNTDFNSSIENTIDKVIDMCRKNDVNEQPAVVVSNSSTSIDQIPIEHKTVPKLIIKIPEKVVQNVSESSPSTVVKLEDDDVSIKGISNRPKGASSTKSKKTKKKSKTNPKPKSKSMSSPKLKKSNKNKVEMADVEEPLPVVKVQKKVLKAPRWSNGWIWQGEPYEAHVFLNCDKNTVMRKCYPSMRHMSGDCIRPHDCVLLLSGSRATDLPFIAKISALWESPVDGEMMISLLWYYRPDSKTHHSHELHASKHKDVSSVACIDDKCYVLTYNEYCRFRRLMKRMDENVDQDPLVVPTLNADSYSRSSRLPPPDTNPSLVYFCRTIYDYRQKRVIKTPGLASYCEKN